MTAYAICKNCGKKILTRKPSGSIGLQNVDAKGVSVEGGKISFKPGGSISFGKGGSISFGGPPGSMTLVCPECGKEFEYSITEIVDED